MVEGRRSKSDGRGGFKRECIGWVCTMPCLLCPCHFKTIFRAVTAPSRIDEEVTSKAARDDLRMRLRPDHGCRSATWADVQTREREWSKQSTSKRGRKCRAGRARKRAVRHATACFAAGGLSDDLCVHSSEERASWQERQAFVDAGGTDGRLS